MGDRYDDMVGADLAEELADRELPVSGRVDELRARLREDDERRAQQPEDPTVDAGEGEDTEADDVDVPEPREPVDYVPMAVVLTEDQARQLTAGEARLRQFTKHVTQMTARKYCVGDRVTGIAVPATGVLLVLPFGIEVTLETPEED